MARFFLNDRAARLSEELLADAGALGVIGTNVAEARVIDAGVDAPGGLAAGVALARLCLADLGHVAIIPGPIGPMVQVTTDHPVAACLGSQYAGWQLKVGDWFGMGSGPIRAQYGKEELYDTIGLRETAKQAIGVIETRTRPTPTVIRFLANKLLLPPAAITLWVAPTASPAGGVQVVARSVEVALHKLHELKYDLTTIYSGFGTAPLPPPGKDDLKSLGRTNDAILYGGKVNLWVRDSDERLADIGPTVPACASPSFGTTFLELFKAANHDFYAMDKQLFAPAEVVFHNMTSGKTFAFGKPAPDVLRQSFGL
jgi:methenyltetrahydromethanopterin cyclohydrolase